MAIAIVEELWTRIRAAIDDKIVAATDARDQAVTAAQATTEDAARAETAATTAEMWAAGMAAPDVDRLGNAAENLVITPGETGGIKTLTLTGDTQIALLPSTAGVLMTLAIEHGANGPHSILWPKNIAWQATEPPPLSTEPGLIDVVTLMCLDGLKWFGFVSGLGLAFPEQTIRDSFNRADSPTLGVTDTGQEWVETGWKIQGNRAHATMANARMAVDSGQSENVEVSIEARTGGLDSFCNFHLNARENITGTTRYSLHWAHLFNTNSAYIRRVVDGEQTDMGARFSLGANVGDRVGLRCQLVGDEIILSAVVNGVPVATRTDPAPIPHGTYVGLTNLTSTLAVANVDEFRVDYL